MFDEEDLLPISALQHLIFCERRCALIYIESLWDENPFTVEGAGLHERAHDNASETRGDVRIARGVRLRSLTLGLSGIADVVEFHRTPDRGHEPSPHSGRLRVPGNPPDAPPDAIPLAGASGLWRPFPVEYKRGRQRHEEAYEVQLCAQAMCLEEMLHVHIPHGALFYGKSNRRMDVTFDDDLRARTEAAAARLHELARAGKTPPARYEKKCDKCSLINLCMPKTTGTRKKVGQYLSRALREEEGDMP